jgi:uncharacterized protein (TIGR03382 family)
MSRTFVALTVPLAALAGCGRAAPQYETIEYPQMVLAQASLEFGEAAWGASVERTLILSNEGGMTMGVGSIELGDGTAAYVVSYDRTAIECPAATTDTGMAAGAKSIDVDTGGGDPVDTGGGDDTGGTGAVEGALFVLDPGCHIPIVVAFTPTSVGDVYDALIIESVGTELTKEEEDAGEDLPAYLADPIHTKQVAYLHGEAEHSQGSVVVRPRSYDFGYVHPDAAAEDEPARIQISNVGDGDTVIESAELSSSCDTAFSRLSTVTPGQTLGPGESTLVEVAYTPTDTVAAYCQLTVTTDDPANPTIAVTLTGNSGTDPENVPPTVYVRSPEIGYRYSTIRPLELELNIFDLNQPATSLVCKVKSAVLQAANVADCDATDASGHVFVDIPAENLDSGVDTLLVTVTDGSGTSATASVSVVINADYPEDDDDGDGFGATTDPADCDDGNSLTYPEAAEVYDLEDNNCDGIIDEGTIGSDDDGDGVAEVDGDCNDYSEDVFPGAPERGDGMDNDCDGTVDESTSLHDDDGDGYAEVNNDCNDNDPAISPSATEVCDGVDNDCDGLRDSADGCVATDSDPVIVGDTIRMEQSSCLEAEVIGMDVMVFDADGQVPTYSWSTDGDGTFDNATAQAVNFTAPAIAGDTAGSGRNENIYAVVLDPDGHQDWAFDKLAVYDDNTKLYDPYTKAIAVDSESSGCNTSGTSPMAGFALAGLGLALVARRRS